MNYDVADLLTRIRNGQLARKSVVTCRFTGKTKKILDALSREGFIESIELHEEKPRLVKIFLKYFRNTPVIQEIVCVSKPSRRIYTSSKNLVRFQGGLGTYILTTPKGVLSVNEAIEHNVGGEILCKVA